MQAVWYEHYGPPSVLRFGERALPEPGPGQVRVRVLASALAQVDVKLRAGLLQAHFPLQLPKIPGRDGAGVIDALGPGVDAWRVGDEVCVLAAPLAAGTAASHVVCEVSRVVARPAGLGLEQAAALLQPGASAWAAVMAASLQAGMRVLVHGGSGAVGALVVQQARALGAQVTATCHHSHREHTLAQGAHEVIAYDQEEFGHLRDLDVVFDFVGGQTHDRSYALLRPGGAIVYLVAAPFKDRSAETGVRVQRAMVSDAPEVLQAVAHAASQGIYRPLVSQVMALQEASSAHAALERGEVRKGRVVFRH